MSPSVPLELTRFVGRDTDLADLRRLLGTGRLLTLTGAGGSGKTRLATEVLRDHRPEGIDEVAFVELASIIDPSLISTHVAESFGVREDVACGDHDGLIELLHDRTALLVLDNCEHLVEPCARLADAILRRCPHIRILATSREALGVKGERAWPVPALGAPPAGASFDDISNADAVQLFIDRARDVSSDFELNANNAPVIGEICRRLDGIPLAIELAAARARVLSVEQIRDRLDDAFRLLTTGGRTAVPRHRTLRAAMDWSHDLLSESARVLLRRLSVFRGDFSLEAVEAIAVDDVLPVDGVLDLVAQLANRSLVLVREHGGEARYSLLHTVRQYATQRLAESGDETPTRYRQAMFFLEFAERAEPHLTRPTRRTWIDRMSPDIENFREVLGWTRQNDETTHVRLAGALWWFWFSTQHWTEARHWIERALELATAREPGIARAKLLFAGGALAALQTRCDDATTLLEQAEPLAREAGDECLLACTWTYLALAIVQTGNLAGAEHATRAEAWFRQHNDLYFLRLSLLILATAAQFAGNMAESRRLNLQAIEAARAFGQDRELSIALQNTASALIQEGNLDEATAFVVESLAALRRDPSWLFIARSLDIFAEIESRVDPLRAARVLGASSSIRSTISAQPFKVDRDRLDVLVPALRASAGEAFDRAWAEGATLSVDEILAELVDGPGAATAVVAPEAAGHPVPVVASPERNGNVHVVPDCGGADVAWITTDAVEAVDLEVLGLGRLVLRVAGQELDRSLWPYAKPRELLLYLVCHRNGRTREQVGLALWPGSTPKQIKNSFHVTLHHLRKVLGHQDWIAVQSDRYQLDPARTVSFDADTFEQEARTVLKSGSAVDATTLRTVLARYRGDLFESELAAPWYEEHQDRLRRFHVDVSLRLAGILDTSGDVDGAAQIYHDIAIREDLNEEAHRGLMSCWARTGARSRALKHYQHVVDLLRDAIDAEPEPETTELYDRIRATETVRLA